MNFAHGQIDPESFEGLKAGLNYDFPEDKINRKETSVEPKLKVFVKSDHLTYSNLTSAAKGSIIMNFNIAVLDRIQLSFKLGIRPWLSPKLTASTRLSW